MDALNLNIGSQQYALEIAETDEDRYEGLAGDDELANNEGMFFVFEENGVHPMVMRGMEMAIDIIHISQEGLVNTIATVQSDDSARYEGSVDSRFVIEIAAGEVDANGLKVGDTIKLPLELHQYLADTRAVGIARNGGTATAPQTTVKKYNVKTTDIPKKDDHLQVLDHDGKVLSNIKLGARIFSRPHTKVLVDAANAGDDEESLKKLGKLMVEMIRVQDTQAPEYST